MFTIYTSSENTFSVTEVPATSFADAEAIGYDLANQLGEALWMIRRGDFSQTY